MGVDEIRQYLSRLATDENVAAATQNVALAALLFLYREVLSTHSYLNYLLVLSILISVVGLFAFWYYSAGKYQRRVIQCLWLPMLSGVTMLIG